MCVWGRGSTCWLAARVRKGNLEPLLVSAEQGGGEKALPPHAQAVELSTTATNCRATPVAWALWSNLHPLPEAIPYVPLAGKESLSVVHNEKDLPSYGSLSYQVNVAASTTDHASLQAAWDQPTSFPRPRPLLLFGLLVINDDFRYWLPPQP